MDTAKIYAIYGAGPFGGDGYFTARIEGDNYVADEGTIDLFDFIKTVMEERHGPITLYLGCFDCPMAEFNYPDLESLLNQWTEKQVKPKHKLKDLS